MSDVASEVIAWTRKYERLRLLLTKELGLAHFDDIKAAEARGRDEGIAWAVKALRLEGRRAALAFQANTAAADRLEHMAKEHTP